MKSAWLLAVDPSIRSCGVALFCGGTLAASGRIVAKKGEDSTSEIASRCLAIANDIHQWVCEAVHPHTRPRMAVVTEWPQIYRAAKSKGNPNDLVALPGVGVAIAALVASDNEFRAYTPAEWCGQVEKTVLRGKRKVLPKDPRNSARGARIWERLTEQERVLVQLQHDVFDAVGIGLKALGRYEPRRVYPGAP